MKTSKIITLMITITCLILLFNSCDNNTTKPNPVTGISLNQTTLSMQIGDTRTLTAIITPENATNKGVIWSSSNSSIASISDTGLVTALTQGSATITVTTQDGGFTDSCQVLVTDPNIPVTGVSLNHSTLSIDIGSSETLIATITPPDATNQNVTWVVSNIDIATISTTGVVTALAQGTATITVRTHDGDFTDTCQVIVTVPDIPVTDVSLNYSTLSIDIGYSETLIATIIPANATNQNVSWTSSNSSIASVSDTGVVTAIAQGTATITVTTQDGDFTDTCQVIVTDPNIPVTGVSLNHSSLSLDIDSTETLIATITPANATNQNVSWTSSNSSIASISDTGVVTAIAQGSATITVTTQDGDFTDICDVTVNPAPTATVIINLTTSDGGSVIGATVVLQNHVGGEYQETATSSSVILDNIPFGSYSVIVSHSGYHPFIDENLSVQTHTVSHAVHLIDTNPQIGDIIEFGAYTWRVLDRNGGQVLIVSENIIEDRFYHTSWTNITWAECSLRAYLNNNFYNSIAFSNEDRSRIIQVTNVNLDNQWHGAPGGVDTNDRIFLLSIAEMVKYFGDSGQLENRPPDPDAWQIDDQYNSNRIATFNDNPGVWWLRSPGYNDDYVSYISPEGTIHMVGIFAEVLCGVRPALWINL